MSTSFSVHCARSGLVIAMLLPVLPVQALTFNFIADAGMDAQAYDQCRLVKLIQSLSAKKLSIFFRWLRVAPDGKNR